MSGEIYRQNLHFGPVFPMKSLFAQEVCPFITDTLPAFIRNKSDYNLLVLLHYYYSSYTANFDEHRYLFASMFMEAFKFYWAKNVSSYYAEVGTNGVIKRFKLRSSRRPVTFKKLLTDAAKQIGYTVKDTTFIDNRNALFHSGVPVFRHLPSSHPSDDLWNDLLTLYDDIDGVLLTLLDYTDPIQTARHPNSMTKVTN